MGIEPPTASHSAEQTTPLGGLFSQISLINAALNVIVHAFDSHLCLFRVLNTLTSEVPTGIKKNLYTA